MARPIVNSLYLLFITFSLSAFASGVLSLEPSYDPQRDRTHFAFGLGVWQKITPKIAYNSWTGFGDSYDGGSKYHSWYVSKHQADFDVTKALTFSPGVRLNYLDDQENGFDKRLFGEVFAKIQYKLW